MTSDYNFYLIFSLNYNVFWILIRFWWIFFWYIFTENPELFGKSSENSFEIIYWTTHNKHKLHSKISHHNLMFKYRYHFKQFTPRRNIQTEFFKKSICKILNARINHKKAILVMFLNSIAMVIEMVENAFYYFSKHQK